MQIIKTINFIISVLFTVCYSYQILYILIPFIKKPKAHKEPQLHRYAALICARNEECVIANLIESIRAQSYPAGLIEIFVAADNCTDNTAEIARKAGAKVFIRHDNRHIGKGYALDFLLKSIGENYGDKFDGYFVFDADNVLDPDFVKNMNRSFSDGFEVVTGYRNSKNFPKNWISAGYGLWFLREAKYLNYPRMLLGNGCAVSGTGFMFSRDVLKRLGGWNFHTLIEDIEFTVYCTVNGIRIGYCKDAVFYDEQPVTFAQSWRQRVRWARGYLQVYKKYGFRLIKGIFQRNVHRGFSCFDMSMTIMPALFLSISTQVINILAIFISLILGWNLKTPILSFLQLLGNSYALMFAVGLVTAITEWKNIHTDTFKKILYIFTFPLFMFTYLPITVSALFGNVEWKPIAHTYNVKLRDILNPQK